MVIVRIGVLGRKAVHSATGKEILRIDVWVGDEVERGGNELGVLKGKAGRGGSENGSKNGSQHACAV